MSNLNTKTLYFLGYCVFFCYLLFSSDLKEQTLNRRFSELVGAKTEVCHDFCFGKKKFSKIFVDIETENMVFECGFDRRSSLDSVQQAVFFQHITGKTPAIVIYDTDGVQGKYEYRIGCVCKKLGINFFRVRVHDLYQKPACIVQKFKKKTHEKTKS